MWSQDNKSSYFYDALRLFDYLEIKPQQSRIILRIPYKLVKISSDFSTISHELTMGNQESMRSVKYLLSHREKFRLVIQPGLTQIEADWD